MPRPNAPRSIASEAGLARRIADLREKSGMSYDGLASRMEAVGCPINPTGIYKIEKAGRRITVDELVGFSRVFDIRIEKLILPPELAAADQLTDLVVAWSRAQDAALAAQQAEEDAWRSLKEWVSSHPEHADAAEKVLRYWSEHYFDQGHDFRTAYNMWKLTGDKRWQDATTEAFNVELEGSRDA